MSDSNSTVTTIDAGPKTQESSPASKRAAVVKGNGSDSQLSGKRATITISLAEGELGGEAVLVGVNGVMYQIPRGTPQSVPIEVVEGLRNARYTMTQSAHDGTRVERVVPRHTFQIEAE